MDPDKLFVVKPGSVYGSPVGRVSREAVAVAIGSEGELAVYAAALAGDAELTASEKKLIKGHAKPEYLDALRNLIAAGDDPLGEFFLALRSAVARRDDGAVYTPAPIVDSMVGWAANEAAPSRVVDPGAGSGRYIIAAARAFPDAKLVACDIDPLALLMLRANAAVLGFADRLDARLTDFRKLRMPKIKGATFYVGNPPYVRHHKISDEAKDWFAETATKLGFKASKLAGLHIHFFLRTREIAQPGDYGCYVTSAEWMDVNYGSVLRQMLADGLGGSSLQVFSPDGMPFADAMTTGAITCFRVGKRPNQFIVRELSSINDLDDLNMGRSVSWDEVKDQSRWSQIVKPKAATPTGMVPLGDLFRVSRGSVTGNNGVFLEGSYPGSLPNRYLTPAITKARDLIEAGKALESSKHLRRVIALPVNLSRLSSVEKAQADAFLTWAENLGADDSFTARSRSAWWSVSLKEPAPILCTYMGRRPPVFVRNLAKVTFINIAHGLYPKVPMSQQDLDAYSEYLNHAVCVSEGRTYAGGLTKFEPKEVERIMVPCLNRIHAARTDKKVDTAGVCF